MTRRLVGLAVLGALALVVAGDLAAGRTPNPWQAPSLIAFGSDDPAPAAHCSAVPVQ